MEQKLAARKWQITVERKIRALKKLTCFLFLTIKGHTPVMDFIASFSIAFLLFFSLQLCFTCINSWSLLDHSRSINLRMEIGLNRVQNFQEKRHHATKQLHCNKNNWISYCSCHSAKGFSTGNHIQLLSEQMMIQSYQHLTRFSILCVTHHALPQCHW